MPSIDFEVFCGTCGSGLCSNSDVRYSKNRCTPQIVVNVCDNCMKEKQDEIDELLQELKNLKGE